MNHVRIKSNNASLLLIVALALAVFAGAARDARAGYIAAWGWNFYGQLNIPDPNTAFSDVSGGYEHSLGLKADGSIVGWGDNSNGQLNVPAPNSGFTAIAAGYFHNLGLKSDG